MPFANRNLFVDGALDHWTTNSAPLNTLATAYNGTTLWHSRAGEGGAGTISLMTVNGEPQRGLFDCARLAYFARFSQTTASTGTFAARTLPVFRQCCEYADLAAGRTLTISAKLRTPTGAKKVVGIQAAQVFGITAGTVEFSKAVAWDLTTTFKRYSARIDVPAIVAGQPFDFPAHYFSAGLMFDPAVGDVDIAELQLELSSPHSSDNLSGAGGAPTTFEYRGFGPELARVQRFYEILPPFVIYLSASASGVPGWSVPFYTKRAPPAMSAAVNLINATGWSIQGVSVNSFMFTMTVTAQGWYSVTNSGDWIADARL
ncbi:hypothetical protein AB3X94_37155 [Paraburkholderia sp. BR10923]|uniref:hypothetical protein n=1 Tax=Paraburkholderia sp. BR10923 TaxID=3236992 RepID=UPI0034CD1349